MDRSRSAERPRPRDPQEIADEVSERRSRALEEPLDLRLRQREPFPIIEVRNPLHQTSYLVLRPTFPDRDPALCTCIDFARRGLGTCKHIEAAHRWLANHPTAVPSSPTPGPVGPAVWHEIDRRFALEAKDGRPASLRIRGPGAALFESGPAGREK